MTSFAYQQGSRFPLGTTCSEIHAATRFTASSLHSPVGGEADHTSSQFFSLVTMPPKGKKSDLLTHNKGGKAKSKRRNQPPHQLYDTEDEEGLSPQEELDLRLVSKMLADINTKLAAHDAQLTALAPQSAMPSDKESDVKRPHLNQETGPPKASCAQPIIQW